MNRPMSVGVRIPAGIEAAAAGNTDRRLTERVLKQNSFLGQCVVIRRRQLSIAQTAQAVRPQLVRDKKQTIFLFSIVSFPMRACEVSLNLAPGSDYFFSQV